MGIAGPDHTRCSARDRHRWDPVALAHPSPGRASGIRADGRSCISMAISIAGVLARGAATARERDESPPLLPAVATALCATLALAACVAGPGMPSHVLYALSYVAGGTMAAVKAAAELRRLKLSV